MYVCMYVCMYTYVFTTMYVYTTLIERSMQVMLMARKAGHPQQKTLAPCTGNKKHPQENKHSHFAHPCPQV